MKIRVCGIEITKWKNLSVTLLYDSIKSIFSFDLYWDPFDPDMRPVMLPGGYNQCTIVSDKGDIILTGVLINPSFKSSSEPCLVNISGYSLTGVLDDCEYSAVFPGTQRIGMTFLQIAQEVCNKFGIGLLDNSNGLAAKVALPSSDTDRHTTVANYLTQIAMDSDIVLSHDNYGNLVLSVANDSEPVYDFTQGMPGIEFSLSFDGARMHSSITVEAQGGSTQSVTIKNPYVAPQGGFNYRAAANNNATIFNNGFNGGKFVNITTLLQNEYNTGYRPHSEVQTSTESSNIQDVAQQVLADELKAIEITIEIHDWELDGELALPNCIITVQNPELYLFNKARLFVSGVVYSADEKESTATLICNLPECFNGKIPTTSIFYETNYTNFVAGPDDPAPLLQQPQVHDL